jgi:hypothetical protein
MRGRSRWRILDEFFDEPSTLLLRRNAVQDDNFVGYRNPGIALPVADALTEVLRHGAGTYCNKRWKPRWLNTSRNFWN